MNSPEEVSKKLYEALLECLDTDCGELTDGALISGHAAIALYEQYIKDQGREEYERGEIETAQSVAFNKGESR